MTEKVYVTQSSMPPFDEYVEMIRPLWDSHQITNMGVYHNKLEKKLQEYLNVNYLSVIVNGHTALELAIQLMDFPKKSEVITTPYTFISTTHAIIRNGLTPVFCDIKDDFTIDDEKIESLITDKTVAILPVHVYGNLCNVNRIQEIALKYKLKVIYDAAHAFGERYQGKGIGSYGDISVFSFHATKVYNTIEGGAICCHTKEQYDKLYELKNFGINSEELTTLVGTNAKMNEFQAAMGLCNLKYVDENIKKRKEIIAIYRRCLQGYSSIKMNYLREDVVYNYAYMPILLENKEKRDYIYSLLKKHNIYSRKYFYPITSDAACFKNKYCHNVLDRSRDYSDRILVLPLYDELTEEMVQNISEIIIQGISQ